MSDLTPMLSALCPMHAELNATGHIVAMGPTLQKLRSETLIGARFLETFEVLRPSGIKTMGDLLVAAGNRLRLQFRKSPTTVMKGVLVPTKGGGGIVNLSFGISLVEAVQTYGLTNADFDPTDLSIEMLYLIEAKSAAMDASRTLNRRLQVARIAAEEQAYTDGLTGLKNRRALDQILDRLFSGGQGLAIMTLDLDLFKQVNDTLGHAAGDFVLQETTRRMLGIIREGDSVARVGGDEFVLVFANNPSRDALADIATRLIAAIERPMLWQGQACHVSASAGIALQTGPVDADALIARADAALYMAKRAGRAQFRFSEN